MAYVRLSQVHFSAEARGPHLSPCFTPVCGFITVILLAVEMCELTKPSKPEEDLQDPGKAQGPVEVQLLGAEVGKSASLSASCAPGEGSHPACYELLWGPWAYMETSTWQVMVFVLRVNQKALRAFHPCLQRLQGIRKREPEPEQQPGDPSLWD